MSESEIVSLWVKTYSREMYSWAKYKTSSTENAKELVQETFLAAFKSFSTFRNESDPKTWLFSILNNKLKEYYRTKSSLKIDSESENQGLHITRLMFDNNESWRITEEESDWDEINLLDNPEFLDILETCINHLPEKWKIAVLMKYRMDQDAHSICQELDLSSTNYWQVMHRAKLMLKKCIDLNW